MEAIFCCSEGTEDVLETQYKSIISNLFYEGDIGTIGSAPINLFLESGLQHPISIVRLVTPNRITYRRSQRHIQANQVDVYVLWRIQAGGVRLNRTSGNLVANEGQILVHDSASPFFAELLCDERGSHESLQAVIPAHFIRQWLGGSADCSAVLDIEDGPLTIANEMLEMLGRHGQTLSRDLANSLTRSLIHALGEALNARLSENSRRSMHDRRLEEIEQFISRNLTRKNLTAGFIARSCNISSRYLWYILKEAGYTFTSLVWDKRLERAREWLVAPKMQKYFVHEIAHMAGFTSAAHFSRMFKSCYGCTPTAYRRNDLGDVVPDTSALEMLH